MDERALRNASYDVNLAKEKYEYSVFIKWLEENGWSYEVNPENSDKNIHGSDITIWKLPEHKMEIDLKGCQRKYDNVALSYERSYDGIKWFSTLHENKITTHFIFIDEIGNIFCIAYDDVRLRFHSYEQRTAKTDLAGHHNKVILIPKKSLNCLRAIRRRIIVD